MRVYLTGIAALVLILVFGQPPVQLAAALLLALGAIPAWKVGSIAMLRYAAKLIDPPQHHQPASEVSQPPPVAPDRLPEQNIQ